MDAATAEGALKAVATINNIWPIVAIVIIGGFVMGGLWIKRVAANSAALDAKTKELIAEKELRTAEGTAHRTKERDAQMSAVNGRLDAHLEDHKKMDAIIQQSIDKLDTKLTKVGDGVHAMSVEMARVTMYLDITRGKDAQHEHQSH